MLVVKCIISRMSDEANKMFLSVCYTNFHVSSNNCLMWIKKSWNWFDDSFYFPLTFFPIQYSRNIGWKTMQTFMEKTKQLKTNEMIPVSLYFLFAVFLYNWHAEFRIFLINTFTQTNCVPYLKCEGGNRLRKCFNFSPY